MKAHQHGDLVAGLVAFRAIEKERPPRLQFDRVARLSDKIRVARTIRAVHRRWCVAIDAEQRMGRRRRRLSEGEPDRQVEFRIASCLETLGKKRSAIKSYELAELMSREV